MDSNGSNWVTRVVAISQLDDAITGHMSLHTKAK